MNRREMLKLGTLLTLGGFATLILRAMGQTSATNKPALTSEITPTPEKKYPLNPKLGGRADTSEAVENALKIGGSWVRIYGYYERIGNEIDEPFYPHFALKKAEELNEKYGLKTLFVFSPTSLPTTEEVVREPNRDLRTQVRVLLTKYQIDAIEILNE